MLQSAVIQSRHPFNIHEFIASVGATELTESFRSTEPPAWGFIRQGKSTTQFIIEQMDGYYVLSMDSLAAYDDYKLYPYLVDCLSNYLNNERYNSDGKSAFEIFDEEWIEDCIGEEIAYLKCILSLGHKYYIELPIIEGFPYVDIKTLEKYGVSIHSSTPRIYGYVNFLLKRHLIPVDKEMEVTPVDGEIMVDVPQHESIGTVLSWQTDGSETTESYSQEDVDLLLKIAKEYQPHQAIEGVVLNDIATLFEKGIGMQPNIETAIYWYNEAIKQGDHLYAPTSLGDIYRKGNEGIAANLTLAVKYYQQSTDPYAWYRIGQSFEEGWTGDRDMEQAMFYYKKAASVGHHLAKDRLKKRKTTEDK